MLFFGDRYIEFLAKTFGGGAGGSGEINIGENIGVSGIGIYDSKLSQTLRFRKIRSLSSALSIVNNGADSTVDFDLDTTGITGSLNDLDDTSITSVTDGQILTWDNTISRWINVDLTGGLSLYMDDLLDVNIPSTPDSFDFLVWNSLKGYWENGSGLASKIELNPMAFTDILNNPDLTTSQDAFSILDTHGHPASDITDLNTAIDNRIDLTILNDLSDVNADSPSNEQLLSWDSSTSKWIPRTVTDNDTDNLNDLTDTNLTTPVEGDILKYNSSSEWENQKDTKTLAITLGSKGTDLDLISSYPIYAPFSGTIKRVIGVVNTAPTGADLIIDINIDGTSIWNTTQANRLTISASSSSGTQTSFDTTSVTEGDVITIDIDQIGSTIAGQDLTVQIEINKS